MNYFDIFLIAFGLSMDACAVSISKGMCIKEKTINQNIVIGLWFGVFQGLMPLIGYFLGMKLSGIIQKYDGIIALFLLSAIGINMIVESRKSDEDETNTCETVNPLAIRTMFLLAIGTSVDAFATGITFVGSAIPIHIIAAIIIAVTFVVCMIGTEIGRLFGTVFSKWAELAGGIILILVGINIFLH